MENFFQAPLSESQRDFLINRDEMQNRLNRPMSSTSDFYFSPKQT
jgi:hypothetical protein